MVRRAHPTDVLHLIKIGWRLVSELLHLRPSGERMQALLIDSISNPQHLVLTSTDDEGNVVGGAVAITQQFAYAEKSHIHIVAIYSTQPGDTTEMVQQIVAWFLQRRMNLLLCYASPVETKLDKLLLCNGFKCEGTIIVRRRYGMVEKDR